MAERRPMGVSAEQKNTEKIVTKVVSGKTKPKKKSEIKKFTDIFIAEDINNVKSYIFADVIVPAVKKAIVDVVKNGIEMLVYSNTDRHTSKSNSSKVSYRGYYEDNRRVENSRSRSFGTFDYDDIIFDNRGDAEAVLSSMDDIIDRYGFVSVADLYDLADITTHNYMVHKYGWDNLVNAQVVRVRDGYMIKLPKAKPIK